MDDDDRPADGDAEDVHLKGPAIDGAELAALGLDD
jgi:hypothetical protein